MLHSASREKFDSPLPAVNTGTVVQRHDELTKVGSHRRNRPHTKSRGGCFSCKARRVKCQETFPICENCRYKKLVCVYPSKAEQRNRPRRGDLRPLANNAIVNVEDQTLVSPQLRRLTSSPSNPLSWMTFNPDDMRFFHHFLIAAYPHLPFGSDKIWITDIPKHAHHSPLLMHSILALGATHLSLTVPSGQKYLSAAVEHRGIALKSLAEMMSRQCSSLDMSHMLATCYALTFQSHYMPDSLVDFAVMVRGCALMTDRIQSAFASSAIFTLNECYEFLSILERISPTASIDPILVDTYLKTLVPLLGRLETHAQHQWYYCLVNVLTSLKHSDKDAYLMFTRLYRVWYDIDHSQFLEFLSGENPVSQILLLHFIAVHVIMIPILIQAGPTRIMESPLVTFAFLQWADAIYDRLPLSVRQDVQWPMNFIKSAKTLRDMDALKDLVSTGSNIYLSRITGVEGTLDDSIATLDLEIQE